MATEPEKIVPKKKKTVRRRPAKAKEALLPSSAPDEAPIEKKDEGSPLAALVGSLEETFAFQKPPDHEHDVADDDNRCSPDALFVRDEHLRHRLTRPTRISSSFAPRRSRSKNVVLTFFVIFLFGAAMAGITKFVQKNGAPDPRALVTALFSKKVPQNTVPVVEAPTPVPAIASVTFVVNTKLSKDETRPSVASRVIETDVKQTATFPATGEGAVASGKSAGRATIHNETSRAYTFVATTRLLSKDGVLFRMKATTPIPANGSVVVDVAADQPGPQGDIGPTTFTIPGLPPATQKDVTAKSDSAMTGGASRGKVATTEDIAAADAALTEKLKKEADDNFAAIAGAGEKILSDLVTSTKLSVNAPKPDAPGANFSYALSLRFRALLVPEKTVLPLLTTAMATAIPAGASIADYSLGSVLYTVQAYDTATERAEIRAEAPLIRN